MAKMDGEPFRLLAPNDSASDVALRQRSNVNGMRLRQQMLRTVPAK